MRLYELLAQGLPVLRENINALGLADYYFIDVQGRRRQVERKHWGELLADLDGIEKQVRNQICKADETILLVEDLAVPTEKGALALTVKDDTLVRQRSFGKGNPGLYARVVSWLWQMQEQGVVVWTSPSLECSAIAIAAMYRNAQRAESSVLQRYVVKREPKVRKLNNQVLALMGIPGAGVGEVKALALIERFGSCYAVLSADVQEIAGVDGLGSVSARKLLTAAGRKL